MNTEKLSEYAAKRIAEIAADASMDKLERVNRIIAVVEQETLKEIGVVTKLERNIFWQYRNIA